MSVPRDPLVSTIMSSYPLYGPSHMGLTTCQLTWEERRESPFHLADRWAQVEGPVLLLLVPKRRLEVALFFLREPQLWVGDLTRHIAPLHLKWAQGMGTGNQCPRTKGSNVEQHGSFQAGTLPSCTLPSHVEQHGLYDAQRMACWLADYFKPFQVPSKRCMQPASRSGLRAR